MTSVKRGATKCTEKSSKNHETKKTANAKKGATTNIKKRVTTSAKRSNKKREQEPEYNVGPKLELRPLFILVLGFF
jgi:hypothetical protein